MNSFDLFVSRLPLAPGVQRFHVEGHGLSRWRLERFPHAQAELALLERNGYYSVSLRIVSTNAIAFNGHWALDDPALVDSILARLAAHGFIA